MYAVTDRIQIRRLPDERSVIYKVRSRIYASEATVVHQAVDLDGVVWEQRHRYSIQTSKKKAMIYFRRSLYSTGYEWLNGMTVEGWPRRDHRWMRLTPPPPPPCT